MALSQGLICTGKVDFHLGNRGGLISGVDLYWYSGLPLGNRGGLISGVDLYWYSGLPLGNRGGLISQGLICTGIVDFH